MKKGERKFFLRKDLKMIRERRKRRKRRTRHNMEKYEEEDKQKGQTKTSGRRRDARDNMRKRSGKRVRGKMKHKRR